MERCTFEDEERIADAIFETLKVAAVGVAEFEWVLVLRRRTLR